MSRVGAPIFSRQGGRDDKDRVISQNLKKMHKSNINIVLEQVCYFITAVFA